MSEPVQLLLAELHQASSFEEAAGRVLAHAMDMVDRATPGMGARALRGMVHLRPRDAYEGICIREAARPVAAARAKAPGSAVPLAPSTTAWLWVKHAHDVVLLDVAQAIAYDARGTIVRPRSSSWQADFRSREGMLRRHASLIAAMPLRRPGSRIEGFVSVELAPEHDRAGSVPAAWRAVAPALQLLVDVATPFLCELPKAPRSDWPVDDLLPVVHARMRPFVELLRHMAGSDDTVLLLGETGVGKTRLARWCHAQSPRASKPFVAAKSLIGTADNMSVGELFGWARGAFTGAEQARKGLVAEAEGGTLFIDEIDKLPLQTQAMLLSILDDRKFRVLGLEGERAADVRFIVATNADLEAAVAEGRFRLDLYHRIQDLPLHIPALRERRDEIADWARHMLEARHQRKERATGELRLEQAACDVLQRQDWPGNLRQLESVIKRAYILATQEAPDCTCVRAAHVEQALTWGTRGPAPAAIAGKEEALWRALEQTAVAYVEVARARGLSLDHVQALGGLVLDEAVEQTGELAAAVRVLGREKALDGDNQHSLFRTQWKRVVRLAEALGIPVPEPRVRSRVRRHTT